MRLLIVLLCCSAFGPAHAQIQGRVNMDQDKKPHPVRNDVARPNDEVVTLRYFKIKKGTYEAFYKVSVDAVWPYFEKLGSRVIGMWKVIEPDGVEGTNKAAKDYDEVYLSTRYASVDHWKATREGVQHGGNGPDFDACQKALRYRASVTIESYVTFLKGHMAPNVPLFMPGLGEGYEKKP